MISDYSLMLYSSAKDTKAPRGDITGMVSSWRRSIRLQGGFWTGQFTIDTEPLSVVQQIYYESLFDHFTERTGGDVTWEGFVYDMDLDDNKSAPRLDVTVCGYVFGMQWQIVSAGDATVGDASTWIRDIITTNADSLFVTPGRIDSNTLQVYRDTELEQYAWDEIQKITALGDANAMPWQCYVDTGQKVHYRQIPNTPQYRIVGGMKRRRSADEMFNSVVGTYTSNAGKATALTELTNASSITRYGKRQFYLALDGVTADAAAAKQAAILKESAFPRSRTVGSSDLELFSLSGETMLYSPWRIRPGVYRDAQYPDKMADLQATDWLTNTADFVVDEVEVSDGQITLKTSYYTEADILEAQEEYREEYKKEFRKAKKKKRRKHK
jgi:hypothetical protein